MDMIDSQNTQQKSVGEANIVQILKKRRIFSLFQILELDGPTTATSGHQAQKVNLTPQIFHQGRNDNFRTGV